MNEPLLTPNNSSDSSSSSSFGSDLEDSFLRACRNGDLVQVKELLAKKDSGYELNLSCKGKARSNFGWTPLHLATYFGHKDVMEILLNRQVEINSLNENGDTALHKASFIGREDLVMLLLQHNADVNIINGEGRLPRDMTPSNEVGQEIAKLLRAAEATETLKKECKLLNAAREGNIDLLKSLLKANNPPNINCIDMQGNSCLHCAAYRGHRETALLLMQNGIDTRIRNNRGQLAEDLAREPQMKQILNVTSVRKVQKTATRYEGPLLRRSRFLGWKPVWAVLERGVLNYFMSRADSTINTNKRKDFKYLDNARVTPLSTDEGCFVVHFNDGSVHRLSVLCQNVNNDNEQIDRQKWINAFNEHAAYSSHYLWGLDKMSSIDEDVGMARKPLGCMTEALGSATASYEVLQRQLGDCTTIVEALQKTHETTKTMGSSSLQTTALMRFQLVSETTANMLTSLQHCLTLFHQQEEIRTMQLKQEKEKCRFLEEALNVLAKEHHELEQSVASITESSTMLDNFSHKSPRFYDTDDDEFQDAFDDSDPDTLVTTESIFNSPSGSAEAGLNLLDSNGNGDDEDPTNREDDTEQEASNFISFSSRHSMGGSHAKHKRKSERTSSRSTEKIDDDGEDSDDTLVDTISMASSNDTYLSVGGDRYKSARSSFGSSQSLLKRRKRVTAKLKDFDNIMMCQSRTSLPVPMFSRNDFSIWSVLKNCIGKELSKITMPVIFNEPLSFLQRMTEYMEYAKLLNIAAQQEDPVDRMKYIAGFAVSALASNWERLGKPFNPLLGETYELQRPEFRIVCEQVSHHPPISAFYADSPHFTFRGSIYPKLKFWGKSVEIQPKGCVTVELPKWGETYTWTNVNCCVHNIIVGKLWIEQYGTMEVVNHTTGHRGILTFKPAGWASKDLHRVEGFIIDKNKKKSHFLYGKWTEFIKCTDINSYEEYFKENAHKFKRPDERCKSPNESPANTPKKVFSKLNNLKMSSFRSLSISEPEEPPEPPEGDIPKSDSVYSIDIPHSVSLWEADPRPPNTAEFYNFTLFAMSLNEMEPNMKPPKTLCPTDSRLRPDVRRLEAGDIDGAAAEKTRLEEKQRDSRKSRKSKKSEEYASRWFNPEVNPFTKQDDWMFKGGYWDRNYEEFQDIEIF